MAREEEIIIDVNVKDDEVKDLQDSLESLDSQASNTQDSLGSFGKQTESLNKDTERSSGFINKLIGVFTDLIKRIRSIDTDVEIEVTADSEEVKTLKDNLSDVESQAESTADSLNDVSKETDSLNDNTKSSISLVGLLRYAFSELGKTLKKLGIGLVIGAIAKLGLLMSSNQKVVDAFTTANNFLQIAFNEVVEAINNAFDEVDKLTGGFDATIKVIQSALTIAFTPLRLALKTIEIAVVGVQLAWEQSIFGSGDTDRISELTLDLEILTDELEEIGLQAVKSGRNIVENFSEAVDEVTTLTRTATENLSKVNTTAILEQARNLTNLENQAQILEAVNRGLIEQYDVQAESLRQIRDDDNRSIEERIKANNDLGRVLEQQAEVMIANQGQIIASAQARFNANRTIENQVALQDALNERIGVEAQVTGLLSEQMINSNQLRREAIDLIRTEAEAEIDREATIREFQAEQIQNEVERLKSLEEARQIDTDAREQLLRDQLADFELGTQGRIDAQIRLDAFLLESEQARVTASLKISNAERNGRIKNIEAIGQAIGGLTALAGENTVAQKGLGVASAIIDTYVGANRAIAEGGIAGTFAAIGVIATGLANVQQILSTEVPNVSSFGNAGVSFSGGTPSAPSQPPTPNFNIVGASQTNQLTQAVIGQNQEQQPVKAFVVSTEITTQQQLDRQISATSEVF